MFDRSYGSANPQPKNNNLHRVGVVSARRIGPNGPEVRVTYNDRNMTSDWLPVGQPAAAGMMFFCLPRVGTEVLVDHLPTGIEQGVVTTALFNHNNPGFIPSSLNAVAMMADDGAYFEYDPTSKILTVTGTGEVHLNAGGDFLLKTSGNLTATVAGNLTATVTGTAHVTANQCNLNGVLIDASGNTTIPGNLTVQGSNTSVVNINISGTETGGGSA
jgi:phage baseplate assembly protein V